MPDSSPAASPTEAPAAPTPEQAAQELPAGLATQPSPRAVRPAAPVAPGQAAPEETVVAPRGGRVMLQRGAPPRVRAGRSPDDADEVMESNFEAGRVRGNETVATDSLTGGVRETDPGERRRLDELADAIQESGRLDRLIVDQDGNVLEGQHRLEVARRLGIKRVPVTRVVDLESIAPVDVVADAVGQAQRMHPEQRRALARDALTYIDETGSPAAVRKEYRAPRGFAAGWEAALKAVEARGGGRVMLQRGRDAVGADAEADGLPRSPAQRLAGLRAVREPDGDSPNWETEYDAYEAAQDEAALVAEARDALVAYTQGGEAEGINRALRDGTGEDVLAPLVAPTTAQVRVARGVDVLTDSQGRTINTPKAGDVLADSGYASTAVGDAVLDNYAGDWELHLELPRGTRAVNATEDSPYSDQRELILPPGTEYTVERVDGKKVYARVGKQPADPDSGDGSRFQRPPPGVRIRLNRRFDRAREGVRGDIDAAALRAFGKGMRVELAERIGDEGATGAFDPTARVAYIALRSDSPGAMLGSLYHEGLHYLRAAGAFTRRDGTPNAAWTTLEAEAGRWREQYGIDERYAGDVAGMDTAAAEDLRNEEAIAEALADYATRGRRPASRRPCARRWGASCASSGRWPTGCAGAASRRGRASSRESSAGMHGRRVGRLVRRRTYTCRPRGTGRRSRTRMQPQKSPLRMRRRRSQASRTLKSSSAAPRRCCSAARTRRSRTGMRSTRRRPSTRASTCAAPPMASSRTRTAWAVWRRTSARRSRASAPSSTSASRSRGGRRAGTLACCARLCTRSPRRSGCRASTRR